MNRHERRKADAQWRKGIPGVRVEHIVTPRGLKFFEEMQAQELASKPADGNSPQSDTNETQ